MKLLERMAVLLLVSMVSGFGSAAVLAADTKPVTTSPPGQSSSKSKQQEKESPAPVAAATRGNDQLVLDSTLVTGNRELPKVMYIVPWKKAELSALPGQPFSTLIDETLAPVDREVFRREVDYYQVISDKDRAVTEQTSGKQATPAADRK